MSADPFNLARFVEAQAGAYETALAELRRGRKVSHWMWFVFPQIAGLGSSPTARFYAVASLDEARAYLAHPVLGPRLKACVTAVLAHAGRPPREIFGAPDDLKFRSSVTLFHEADPQEPLFRQALSAFFGGELDPMPWSGCHHDLGSPIRPEGREIHIPARSWAETGRASRTRTPMDLRILIVDDEATNRQVLDQAVRAFGHTTTLACDGPEALALLAAGRFDAVLLDLHMPQLSGLDVLERMRAEPGPNQDTAVVCVTADVLSRRPDEYLDLGFQAFLAKPVQIAKLAAVIDRVTAASIEDQRQQRTAAKLAALRRRMDASPPQ